MLISEAFKFDPSMRITLTCNPEADGDPTSKATEHALAHNGVEWRMEVAPTFREPMTLNNPVWEPTGEVPPGVFILTRQEIKPDNPRHKHWEPAPGYEDRPHTVWHYEINCPMCTVHVPGTRLIGPILTVLSQHMDEVSLLTLMRALGYERERQTTESLRKMQRFIDRQESRRV